MKTVKEVSRLTGVSVRTLHHYHAIGLLYPAKVTEAGYRLYDRASLARLQTILLFRELQFPLKEIKAILEHPDFDHRQILKQQIALLQLQRNRLDGLISLAREILTTGVNTMNFSTFDKSEIQRYAAEIKERFGQTAPYKEYLEKNKGKTCAEEKETAEGLMDIFRQIGKIKHLGPESDRAQTLIENLRQYITANYYTCTPKILQSLSEMYVNDARFKTNIDAFGGLGTAEFTEKAAKIYCERVCKE